VGASLTNLQEFSKIGVEKSFLSIHYLKKYLQGPPTNSFKNAVKNKGRRK